MDSYYLQQILSRLNSLYDLLSPLVTNVRYLLYSVVFFILLYSALQFINKRWLTL